MPTVVGGSEGEQVQTIKVHSPPAAPYTLTAVIPLPTATGPMNLGVRRGPDPTDWFPTDQERIARIHGIDYWEVRARVDTGVETLFPVDIISEVMLPPLQDIRDGSGVLIPHQPPDLINSDALDNLLRDNAVAFELQSSLDNTTARISLTGGFDTEGNRMWTALRMPNGMHRWGRVMRTYYKYLPVRAGGSYGYVHIFATVMPDTEEIQFELNWHNGGIEERRSQAGTTIGGPGNTGTPPDPFGKFRGGRPILFNRVKLIIAPDLVSEGWVWSTRYTDPANSIAANALVRQVATDQNRLHCMPLSFERWFSFAVHKTGTTPYLKHIVGVADWTKDLGGWAFKPLGLPDPSIFSPAIDLTNEVTACKQHLANVGSGADGTWHVEGSTSQGSTPASFLWPASGVQYGGETSGVGMWPLYGSKLAMTGQKAALEILLIEMLRGRSRTYGALYYNISGFPVIPQDHAPGGVANWSRFDRRFTKTSQGVQDSPFKLTAGADRSALAAYNPGPTGFTQGFGGSGSLDAATDPTPNVPDWWVAQVDGASIQAEVLPYSIPLAHTQPPPITSGWPDQSVPVLLQITGAGAYNSAKSITIEVTGTGDADLPLTESITLTGPASSPPVTQAKQTVASFKTVSSVVVTAISGTLLSTEMVSVGRANVGIADYSGANGWTALDDQHYARLFPIIRSLFLLANHPIAKLYCLMDAASSRLTFWEGEGQARRLFPVFNGSPGHGMPNVRELAWYVDTISTAMAIGYGHWGPPLTDFYWDGWRDKCITMFNNAQMTNFAWVAKGSQKEFKRIPYGSRSDEPEGTQIFWGSSSRELAYFVHALHQLANVYGHYNEDLERRILNVATGYRDFWWHGTQGGTGVAPHTFLPVALHRNPDGTIRFPDLGPHPQGTWTVYATQADLPERNPVSNVLLRPATYPTVDDDRFVAAVTADTIVEGTPLTLANTQASPALPVPVEIKVIDGGAPADEARSGIFDIVGVFGGVTINSAIRLNWKQGETKVFRNTTDAGGNIIGGQHYDTITSITLRAGSKTGDWEATCTIRAGVGNVGLLLNNSSSVWPTYAESYQLAYALATLKVLGDKFGDATAIDTIIKRFCGSGGTPAADLAAAKAVMEGWDEYSGGPVGRMEQWDTLLWTLRNA